MHLHGKVNACATSARGIAESEIADIGGRSGLIQQPIGDVWPQVMARKIQLPLSKRPGSGTAAWATLTFAYVAAWALWGLVNASPSL